MSKDGKKLYLIYDAQDGGYYLEEQSLPLFEKNEPLAKREKLPDYLTKNIMCMAVSHVNDTLAICFKESESESEEVKRPLLQTSVARGQVAPLSTDKVRSVCFKGFCITAKLADFFDKNH